MSIPLHNVYYLLCYAWNHLQAEERLDSGGEQFANMADMFGHVLAGAVGGLLKSGLDRDYVVQESRIAGVRGKLNISETLRQQLLWSGRTYCVFDEFMHDVLPNQIIKSTVRSVLAAAADAGVRAELRGILLNMREISDIKLGLRDFARIHVHRNNRGYGFVLRLCRLIHENLIVDRSTGQCAFHDFREDEARMGQLFEDFLFNFYRREQNVARVTRWNFDWYRAEGAQSDLEFLPLMRTDIVLHRPDAVLVMDAKFYQKPLVERYGAEKVRSAHLYQILAYLGNLAPKAKGRRLEGMLLYPVVDKPFGFDYRFDGRRVRVASIDLSQQWQMIRADLLALAAF